MSLAVEERSGATRFRVKVQARARRTEIRGTREGMLLVGLTAPPVEGRANQALVALLSDSLRISKASIKIAGGERARVKLIEVAGLGGAAVCERLGLEPAEGSHASGPV